MLFNLHGPLLLKFLFQKRLFSLFDNVKQEDTVGGLNRSSNSEVLIVDFMNTFRKLPKAFMPSFYKTAWTKRRENLPSSVFKVQVDP